MFISCVQCTSQPLFVADTFYAALTRGQH